jgi:hypothetical protein
LAADMRFERGKGLGTLERKQRAVFQMVERNFIRQVLAQVGDIVPLGRAVDHQQEMTVAAAGDHQVVKHPAMLIQQQRVPLLAQFQCGEIDRQNRLQSSLGTLPRYQQLAHVADIEQSGLLAGPKVFSDDPLILDRHPVPGEFDHPPAAPTVP